MVVRTPWIDVLIIFEIDYNIEIEVHNWSDFFHNRWDYCIDFWVVG